MKNPRTFQPLPGVYPDGNRSIWLLGMLVIFRAVGEETEGAYSVYEQTVPPSMGPPPHIHHQETEAFLVLDGTFEFMRGEAVVRAEKGAFVFVPQGVVHTFKNVGTGLGRFLAITTPGGLHEKLLGELGEPAPAEVLPPPLAAPPDLERIISIGRTYSTEVLSPQPGNGLPITKQALLQQKQDYG